MHIHGMCMMISLGVITLTKKGRKYDVLWQKSMALESIELICQWKIWIFRGFQYGYTSFLCVSTELKITKCLGHPNIKKR